MLKVADQWLLPGSTRLPGGNCSVSMTQRLTPVRVLSAAALPVKPDTRWLPAGGSTIPLGSARPADSHRLNDLSTSQSTCSLRGQSGFEGKCGCTAGFSGPVSRFSFSLTASPTLLLQVTGRRDSTPSRVIKTTNHQSRVFPLG